MSTLQRLLKFLSLLFGLCGHVISQNNQHTVDMENYLMCERQPFTVSTRDTYTVSAHPRQVGHSDTRDKCKVAFAGPASSVLEIKIKELVIYDCGTMISFYDDDLYQHRPAMETLDCHSIAGRSIITRTSNLAILLHKQSSVSTNYNFDMEIKVYQPEEPTETDIYKVHLQPSFVEEMDLNFESYPHLGLHKIVRRQAGGGGGMSMGAIIGIIIAGVLLICIIIGIAVFFYMQNKRNKETYTDQTNIYATESSKKFPSYPRRDQEGGSVSSNNTSNGINNAYPYVNYGYKADRDTESGSVGSSADKSSYSTNYSAGQSSDGATLKSSMKTGGRSIGNGRTSVRFSASTVNEVHEYEKTQGKSAKFNEGYEDDESPSSSRRSRSQSPKRKTKKDGNIIEIWQTNPKPPKPPPNPSADGSRGHGGHGGHGQRSRSRSPGGRRPTHHRAHSGERRHHDGTSRRSRSPAGRPRSASATSKLSQPTSISSEV